MNARICFCLRDVDIDDPRMRNRTSQKFGMQHSRKHKVICILQFADALRFGVDFDEGLSNYTQVISGRTLAAARSCEADAADPIAVESMRTLALGGEHGGRAGSAVADLA